MPERAVFLDRDNTIIEEVGDGYLGDPTKVKLLPGAAAAIATMRRLGFRIIIASNQSGVARGKFRETDVEAVNQEMCRQLREQAAAHIDASYYCPFHPEAVLPEYRVDHEWRKPKAGMLKQAAEDFDLDLTQSWMVGDMPRDIAAGAAAGCRTILLRDPAHPAPANESNSLDITPNFIVGTLGDAARIVAREATNPRPDLVPRPLTTGGPAEIPAAAAGPVSAAVDEKALAEQIAQRLGQALPQQENVRPILQDIATQLRQQNQVRRAPDFSPGRMIGVIAQVLAMGCLLIGGLAAFTGGRDAGQAWLPPILGLLRAGLWLLAGIIFQGLALTLKLNNRE